MQAFSHQYPLAASIRSENLKNFATSFASVVDTGGKFATVVNDTGGNLPPGCWDLKVNMIEDFFHLPQVSTTPVVHLELRISSRIFKKIRNGPNGIRTQGLGGKWFMKKPEVENLVTLSL